MKSKSALQIRRSGSEEGEIALMAWKIVGGVFIVAIVGTIVAMIPELTRYLKLKNM